MPLRMKAIILLALLMAVQSIEGRNLEKKVTHRPAEIILLLDVSWSIDDKDYKRMINTIRSLPDSVRMGATQARIALVTFGKYPHVEMQLTDDETKIRSLSYQIGYGRQHYTTRTPDALKEVKDIVLPMARKDAAKIVVLITDGEPTIEAKWETKPEHREQSSYEEHQFDFEATEQAARDLRNSTTGVVIYVAYMCDEPISNVTEHLIKVAGDSHRVFDSKNFDRLIEAVNKNLEEVEYECDEGSGGMHSGSFIGGMALGIFITLIIGTIVFFKYRRQWGHGASVQINISAKEDASD